MKFHFTFESLKSSTFQQANYTYSMAQIRMNLTRTDKSRQKIFAGYHVTTGIFSALSLVSYFIPPDIVPGRMGMLITLFLILINSYNSVDAPPDRGFSSIEVWFVGTQAIILLAVIEYGIVLAVSMFWAPKSDSATNLFKVMDFCTFLVAIHIFVIFNICYWYW